MKTPKHASHSAISSYLWCGKQYELQRLRKYPEPPSWWLIAGSAIHSATEWIDKKEWDGSPEQAFDTAFYLECQAARERWPDESEWSSAGYGRNSQGYEYWAEKGREYVSQWADRHFEGLVELDVSTVLPSGLEIKAYIDRVSRVGKGHYEIFDLKSGSKRPESDQQLGIYTVLLDLWLNKNAHLRNLTVPNGGIRAFTYMFKDDEFYETDVSHWNLETVDRLAQEWMAGVEASVFLPNRGSACGRCGVADACFLQSGDTATTRIYDRLNPFYTGEK